MSNEYYKTTSGEHVTSINEVPKNHLSDIPIEINQLKKLRVLICSGSYDQQWSIQHVGHFLNLPELTSLDLSYNQIKKLEGLEGLTGLKTLNLRFNQIERIEEHQINSGV